MILNDEKIIRIVNDFNGSPVRYDCILYGHIDGGLENVSPELEGKDIFISGAIDTRAEEFVDKALEVADKAASVVDTFGFAADALDAVGEGLKQKPAILTFYDKIISIFGFDALGGKIICCIDIPVKNVKKIKKGGFWVFKSVTLFFHDGSKIILGVNTKVLGIKTQKENALKFLQLIC